MVLAKVEELEHISVPGLKVDGEGTRALVATLVDISGSVVEDTEHGNDTVGSTVGTGNVRTGSTDAVNVETNTASHLGNHGAGLEGVVDTLNRVVLHVDQEARRQLGLRRTSVEESGRGMGEVFAGHEVVGIDDTLNVVTPDADSDTHDHVLGTLNNLAVKLEKV